MLDGVEESGDADAYVRGVLDRGERIMGFATASSAPRNPCARVLRGWRSGSARAARRGPD